MKHYWKEIEGTWVFINANDDVTALAWINLVDGKYLLNVPWIDFVRDIKASKGAYPHESLSRAKEVAEEEIALRISEFISPAN